MDPKAFSFHSSLSQSQLIAVLLLKYNLKVTGIKLLNIITPCSAHESKSTVMLPWLALASVQLFGHVERSLSPFGIQREFCHSFYFQDFRALREKNVIFSSQTSDCCQILTCQHLNWNRSTVGPFSNESGCFARPYLTDIFLYKSESGSYMFLLNY